MKRFAALLLTLVMLPLSALAGGQYIIPDSDRRELTWDELYEWDYESLGFIFNEIFARHGYVFISGGKYANYFGARPWYTPNPNDPNNTQYYNKTTRLEHRNVDLVKDVMAAMKASGDYNTTYGKHYSDYIEAGNYDLLTGFQWVNIAGGQKAAVYSAPSEYSWRGANGKALVNSNGAIYAAGWENGWLLICYATNNGAIRVGYVQGNAFRDAVDVPRLTFDYVPVTLTSRAVLTDDPASTFTTICTLNAGTTVTYLSTYQNRGEWAYVETTVNGQQVRGFIPAACVELNYEMGS